MRKYRVKVMRPGDRDRVVKCLSRLDLEIAREEESGQHLVLVAVGHTDKTPSQLQMELMDMQCPPTSVEDEFEDVKNDPRVRSPEDTVDISPSVGHDPAEFDVHQANQYLSSIDSLLSPEHFSGTGDADQDHRWFQNPGRQSYEEYKEQCIDELVSEYGFERGAAISLIDQCVDELVAAGHIPPRPEDDALDKEYSKWVGAAKAANLKSMCFQRVD